MPDTPVPFDQVQILRMTGLGFWCRINGREVFVGSAVPLPGTTIAIRGDVGCLVVPRWFADAQRLSTPLH